MGKSKWWKNKETGEVVLQVGSNRRNLGTVFYRVRSGETFSETKLKFFSSHTEIKASGFPSLKPKEFKPRYAIYDHWSDGEAFVMEFEPGKFKVVMKDGREILREGGVSRYFTRFFNDGSWPLVSEAEALARLDKPKPPVPAAEQFGPGPWYGGGLTYRQASFREGYGFYAFSNKTKEFVGWVSYEVVRHLRDLNMVSKERPRNTESIDCQASAILDVPKKAFTPKKVLVEWAIQYNVKPHLSYRTHLFPEGVYPKEPNAKFFKTGRTVEVPE
jgi:hypothetical protein